MEGQGPAGACLDLIGHSVDCLKRPRPTIPITRKPLQHPCRTSFFGQVRSDRNRGRQSYLTGGSCARERLPSTGKSTAVSAGETAKNQKRTRPKVLERRSVHGGRCAAAHSTITREPPLEE